MESLLVWALFGAAAGSLAKGKNRRVWLWVAVGFFLGPFAVLVVALMTPAPGPEQSYN